MRKKCFAFLMTALLTCTNVFCTTLVSAEEKQYIFNKEQSIVNFGNELMDMEDSKAFEIYMAMLGLTPDITELRVDFDAPIDLEGRTQSEVMNSTSDREKMTELAKDAQTAVDAFTRDYPEIFWYDIASSTSSAIIKTENGKLSISGVKIKLKLTETLGDGDAAYDKLVSELNTVLAQTEGLSRYEKLVAFQQYLCEKITYDLEAPNAFNMYGGLVEGKGVCEAYAESLKALCDLSGIPCVIVSGNSVDDLGGQTKHMWNYCLMEDDKWYAIDLTWDDNSEEHYNYFLVGSDTAAVEGGRTFSETHASEGDFSLNGYHSFMYPILSSEPYNPPVNFDGMYGDVNSDTLVNSNDALEILKISAKIITANEYQLEAGDVDGGGSLDAGDALYVLKYAAKIIDSFPVESM